MDLRKIIIDSAHVAFSKIPQRYKRWERITIEDGTRVSDIIDICRKHNLSIDRTYVETDECSGDMFIEIPIIVTKDRTSLTNSGTFVSKLHMNYWNILKEIERDFGENNFGVTDDDIKRDIYHAFLTSDFDRMIELLDIKALR